MATALQIAIAPGFHPFESFSVALLLLGVAIFVAIAALSLEHERPFSAAMIYVGLGVAGALLIHLFDVPWLDFIADAGLIRHVAEIALIIALFGAGLLFESPLRLRTWRVILALIFIAMPITIAAIAGYGVAAMGLSWGIAVALGAILAPTDPVLAGSIGIRPGSVRGDAPKSRGRFNLSGEAALNDSLSSPFALLAIFMVERAGSGWVGEWIGFDVVYAAGAAAVAGGLAGYGLGRLAAAVRNRGLLAPELDAFVVIAIVFVIFGAAEALDMYGLLAVFAAGLGFRRYEFEEDYNQRLHDSSQVLQNFAELTALLLFGTLVTTQLLSGPGLAGWLLIPLLVFVIRPCSVVIATALARTKMPRRERVAVAWFGVKGIASIYLVTQLIEQGTLQGPVAITVAGTTMAAVLISINVHGATVAPLERALLD